MDGSFLSDRVKPVSILIVDDEVLGAMGLESSLKRMGYDVLGLAVNGDMAVRIAGEKRPDIIIMDINLRDEMEGACAAEEINRKYNIPILFLTAHYQDDILKRALRSNPYGYLNKPVRPVELKTAIETAVHKHIAIEAEKRLYMSEKKHRALFDRIALGVMYVSSSMQISDANPAIYDITGVRPEDMIGKSYSDVMKCAIREDGTEYPPEFHPTGSVFTTAEKARDTFGILNAADNCYRWVISTAVFDDEAESEGETEAIVTFEDITERYYAEERFYKAFEMMSVPVAIVDSENRELVDANRVFLERLGYERSDVIGHDVSEYKIFADDMDRKAFYDALANNGGLKDMPVKALTSSGRIRSGYVSAEKITIGKKQQFLISVIENRENFWVF